MCEVIMICGKLCSGKTTYARKLADEGGYVLLSVDALMLAMFGRDAGVYHDMLAERARNYLLDQSLKLIRAGISVILDWGFWTKESRMQTAAFYEKHGVRCRICYLDVDDDVWLARIRNRNAAIAECGVDAYLVDEGLMQKFVQLFEKPDRSEVDIWAEG